MSDHHGHGASYSELTPLEHERAVRKRKIKIGVIVGAVFFVLIVIIVPLGIYNAPQPTNKTKQPTNRLTTINQH